MITVLTCPHCDYSVGEESCTGCRRNVLSYTCSRCKGIVPNPRFASGIACKHCGKQVYEDGSKSQRIYHRFYICQECEKPTENTKFVHDHACSGCKPRTCNDCGGYTAWSPLFDYELCVDCGVTFKLK